MKFIWYEIVRYRNGEVEWDMLMHMGKSNCECDKVSNKKLFYTVEKQLNPIQEFPGEGWFFRMGNSRVTGKILPMVKDHIQRKIAIELLVFKIIISDDIFDNKIWNRMGEQ